MYTRRNGERTPNAEPIQPIGYQGNGFGEGDGYLIPPEYHGEMLRRAIPPETHDDPDLPLTNEYDLIQPPLPEELAPVSAGSATDSHRMTDGIFDLLLGKNSDEEETILLLGIALLLLSGHLDRRDAGWGEDDLALLLIGYLLLG